MASIYLSSTYRDLQPHREKVCQQLRSMKHEVVAMEEYVARDDRPVDVCVRDVAASDLYVGLFAWRYGHIPTRDNPQSLSVTEFELRAAVEGKVPWLVFLLDEAMPWPPNLLDSFTGDGDRGARIQALRQRLAMDRLPDRFTTPEDLAGKVAAAVHVAGALKDASDASLDLAAIVGQDAVEIPGMLFSQSFLPNLVTGIAKLGNAALLKIDLRDGNHWWSTRLYTLATIAHECMSVEWFLFLNERTEYVGMMRPGDLRRAQALAQPELEETYRRMQVPQLDPQADSHQRANQVLDALVAGFAAWPGGEEAHHFTVNANWLTQRAQLSTTSVEWAGPFDPLATSKLLDAATPFVPITSGKPKLLLKVIDRVGVATEIARTVVERRLGRG